MIALPQAVAKSRDLDDFARALGTGGPSSRPRLSLDPDDVKNGLARLVLTLMELLRELLERQAIRRIESGSLGEDEVERLGTTFLRLAEEMQRLQRTFGLEPGTPTSVPRRTPIRPRRSHA
jgi:Gas vesicle protein K